jgi:Ferritin-like domain
MNAGNVGAFGGFHRHFTGKRRSTADVTAGLSRAQLVARGFKGGAALLVAGSAAGLSAGSASADVIPDDDLAYARLLVAAELLGADFYTRAISSKRFDGKAHASLRRARFNERQHYKSVAGVLSGAGQAPAVAADFDFSYPRRSFASRTAIAKLGVTLETILLGAYLGAVGAVQTDALKQPLARTAASEAEHLGVLRQLAGGTPFELSFPEALTIEEASNALDAYTS